MFYKNTGHGHSTWKGTRHEVALTYDFLMRTLKLEAPDQEQLSKDTKSALGKDYALIADGYEFGYELEENKSKAQDYYLKASQLEHGIASYNIGVNYHTGEVVEEDISKAVSYYEKSAKQEYSGAYAVLGRMYMEGEYFAQDWSKALEYLTKAHELDDTPANNVTLGRFYCTAPKVYQDVDRCLKLLDIDQYKKHSKTTANKAKNESRKALVWIIAEGEYNDEEKQKIKGLLKKTFKLKYTDVTIDIDEEGEFTFIESTRFGRRAKLELIDESFQVVAKDDETGRFGLVFEVDVPGLDDYTDRVAVAVRWVQSNEDGTRKIVDSGILYGSPKVKWKVLAEYKDIKVPGIWRLEIYDLDQNKVHDREYHVTPLAKPAKDIGS